MGCNPTWDYWTYPPSTAPRGRKSPTSRTKARLVLIQGCFAKAQLSWVTFSPLAALVRNVQPDQRGNYEVLRVRLLDPDG